MARRSGFTAKVASPEALPTKAGSRHAAHCDGNATGIVLVSGGSIDDSDKISGYGEGVYIAGDQRTLSNSGMISGADHRVPIGWGRAPGRWHDQQHLYRSHDQPLEVRKVTPYRSIRAARSTIRRLAASSL